MKKNDASPRKRFEEALCMLGRTQSRATAFDDFLDFSLLFIKWWDRKPEEYSSLEKKYPNPNDQQLFAEAYLAMADIADHQGVGFKDPFGDFYMEYLSNDRTGQFFTPETVCDMMAQMQMGTELPDGATICDPCCGSGRLLLSAAKIDRKPRFYAADVDLTCCKMTLLNFLMNTLCGEVAWMNTLSLQHWKSWRVDKVMDGSGHYLPFYQEIDPKKAAFPRLHANTLQTAAPDAPPSPESTLATTVRHAASRSKKGKATNQLFFDFGE
jgi:type I restriction enzyme M protein